MTTTNYKGFKLNINRHGPTRRGDTCTVSILKDGEYRMQFSAMTADRAFEKARAWIDAQEGTE